MGICSAGNPFWAPLSRLTILVLILVVTSCTAKLSDCKVEQCSRKYTDDMETQELNRGPTLEYCEVLKTYMDCLRETARSCRGSLYYHSYTTLVQQWNNEYNCTQILLYGVPSEPVPHRPTRPPRPHQACGYHGNGKHDYKYCSLFGDPHLRTFNNKFQTCKVKGAWPLVDNAYIAVQVTNEAVFEGSSATATTKVTVVIRGNNPSCASEKTYEAQVDNVPSAFIDGTVISGPERAVRIKEKEPGMHVEINVRFIATTVIIRQTARHLSVSIRMPREVALGSHKREGLQLCVRGCPHSEQLDHKFVLTSGIMDSNEYGMSRDEAIEKCQQMKLSGYFFDSCVFDLMATGDIAFRQAAKDAWSDFAALSPAQAANLNKTEHSIISSLPTVAVMGEAPSTSGATSHRKTLDVWLMVIVLVIIFVQRIR